MPRPSSPLPRLPPGGPTLSRDLVTSHQRERVIRATAELIGERGYQETTLEQITKRARIAWTTLYQNFSSKEDCFLAAFDQITEDAARQLSEVVPPDQPWGDRETIAIETLVELIAEDPLQARLCLVEVHRAGPRARARYEAVVERLAAALRQGREQSTAVTWPERLEESTVGGIAWLVQGALAEDGTGRLRALLPEIVQIVLTPYLGEDDANRRALAARSARS